MTKTGGGKLELIFFNGFIGWNGTTKYTNFDDVGLYLATAEGRWGATGGRGLVVIHKDIHTFSYKNIELSDSLVVYDNDGSSLLQVSFANPANVAFLVQAPTLEAVANSNGSLYNISDIEPITLTYNSNKGISVNSVRFMQVKMLS